MTGLNKQNHKTKLRNFVIEVDPNFKTRPLGIDLPALLQHCKEHNIDPSKFTPADIRKYRALFPTAENYTARS